MRPRPYPLFAGATPAGSPAAVLAYPVSAAPSYKIARDCDDSGEPIASGTYDVTNVTSGKLLEVDPASPDDREDVQQWSDNGGANQRWTFSSV